MYVVNVAEHDGITQRQQRLTCDSVEREDGNPFIHRSRQNASLSIA